MLTTKRFHAPSRIAILTSLLGGCGGNSCGGAAAAGGSATTVQQGVPAASAPAASARSHPTNGLGAK